jgi:hypothetical protein
MDFQIIYNKICERGKKRVLESYVEKHHITPKCMGGDNLKENITYLTPKEHFLCHQLLCEIYPNNLKLLYALWLMSIGKKRNVENYKISSRVYERLRIKFIKKITGIKKPKSGARKVTWGDKISKSLKGLPKPEGFGLKITKARKGVMVNNKVINQYNLDGSFIKEWVSQTEASKALNIHYGSISSCCLGKTKSAGKYIWKFK